MPREHEEDETAAPARIHGPHEEVQLYSDGRTANFLRKRGLPIAKKGAPGCSIQKRLATSMLVDFVWNVSCFVVNNVGLNGSDQCYYSYKWRFGFQIMIDGKWRYLEITD